MSENKKYVKMYTKSDKEIALPLFVKCPYCGVKSKIGKQNTECNCIHFDALRLFARGEDSEYNEIEKMNEPIFAGEFIFIRDGSRNDRVFKSIPESVTDDLSNSNNLKKHILFDEELDELYNGDDQDANVDVVFMKVEDL